MRKPKGSCTSRERLKNSIHEDLKSKETALPVHNRGSQQVEVTYSKYMQDGIFLKFFSLLKFFLKILFFTF